ncbi:hypothetical protein GSI_14697 [Ganoderma sinense ZZ0214-1]|uniref:Uncharacterized protein n=1 Tax=Ganoderma sinense ZZ0214-1 TaxID=1077348 RepID=A0A2G8RPF9_9APHY|nr:hypothetical protein GSI_14697 [Ganoderma sinense ZZ0214-1]
MQCTPLARPLHPPPIRRSSPSSGQWHADDTRETLTVYTQLSHSHRGAFSALTTLRLELRPAGSEMLDAFVRIAGDTFFDWLMKLTRTVSADEAEQNRLVWAALEDALCVFPAPERVELVLYERPEYNEILAEEAKAELRTARGARGEASAAVAERGRAACV